MARLTHRTRPGCTYFVSTNAWQSRHLLQAKGVAEIILARLLQCRDQGAYQLHEFVIMPNHLHLLLTPGVETTLEKAVQLIKGGSSREIHLKLGGTAQVWQPGFHEWTVRDEKDFGSKREYIHLNPVEAGLALRPEEWAFSSAAGRYQMDSMPESLRTSGAKAPEARLGGNVGAKAPTP